MVGRIYNPKATITVHIRSTNAASRIQIINSAGEALLLEPATGQVSEELLPDETYSIIHWIGSGLRFSIDWNSGNQPRFILLPDTFFLSATPLPESDRLDQISHASAVRSFTLANSDSIESGTSLLLYARTRLGDREPAGYRAESNLPNDISIGWAVNNEIQAPSPVIVLDDARPSADILLRFDIPVKENGYAVLAIRSPLHGNAEVLRCLPTLGRRLPSLFMCAAIPQSESERPIDWRRALYSLYMGDKSAAEYLRSPEVRLEEAIIDRLSRPGIVRRAIQSYVELHTGGNLIAQLAGWLLKAREEDTNLQLRGSIPGAFFRWSGKATHLLSLVDVSALQYFWRSGNVIDFQLAPPLFSATWHLLAQLPTSAWVQSDVKIDQQSWQIANFANTGGLWFFFTRGIEAPQLNQFHVGDAIAKGPASMIRLIQRIRDASRESGNSSEKFSRLVNWNGRTLLERRVLDNILARGAAVPDNAGDGSALLEQFAPALGIPLPIISLSVGSLAEMDWGNRTSPSA